MRPATWWNGAKVPMPARQWGRYGSSRATTGVPTPPSEGFRFSYVGTVARTLPSRRNIMARLDPEDELERAWALPSDATPLQRLLAFTPKTGPGWVHWHRLVRKLCEEKGLPLPWTK
jgi:hypothetical protein